MSVATYKTVLEAPRWLGLNRVLQESIDAFGLHYIKDIHTGWYKEMIVLTVWGTREDVEAFQEASEAHLRHWKRKE